MNRIINHVVSGSKKTQQHFKKNKHRYGLGTFGIFAVVKVFLLFASFFGIHSLHDVFASEEIQLNSGNVLEYCAVGATECHFYGMNITYVAPDTFVNHTLLEELNLSFNELTEIDLSLLSNIKMLYLGANQLSGIDLGGMINLEMLNIQDNKLSEIDLSGLSQLKYLYLSNNKLTDLDFLGLTGLLNVNLGYNQITDLDISGLTQLNGGDISRNSLSFLWINNNKSFLEDHNVQYIPQNTAPQANNVTIIGNPIVGFTLTGEYEYYYRSAWTFLGEGFVDGNIENLVIDSENIPYIAYKSGINYSIQKYDILNDEWIQLGDPFTDGSVSSLVLDTGNVPYIIYNYFGYSVQKYDFSTDEWIWVGDLFTDSSIYDLVFDRDNTPYIRYYNYEDDYGSIQKYNFSTNEWIQLGNSFTGRSIDNLVIDSENIPYIKYNNNDDNSYSILKYDSGSMSWTGLGDIFTIGNISSLILDSENTPYIIYQDSNGFSILKYDSGSMGWTIVGEIFTDGSVSSLLFATNNTPYLKYNTTHDIGILKYDSLADEWVVVGDGFPVGTNIDLFINHENIPYLMYSRINGSRIFKHDSLADEWVVVGDGFPARSINNLGIDSEGVLYIKYYDNTNNSSHILKFPIQEEGNSLYQWYRDGAPIDGATGVTYILTSGDLDTEIKFGVIPVSFGGIVGMLSQSNALYIPVPVVTQPESNGGGGGGGGGITRDNCPNGDFSPSYYDGICGEQPDVGTQHGSADICGVEDSSYSSELKDAYLYSYKYGITTKCPIEDANLDGYLYRNHFAKMISEFAVNVLGKKPEIGKKGCDKFDDITNETKELKGFIKTACELGLMGIKTDGETPKSSFDPNEILTRAEFGTVLSRLLRGTKHAGGTPYYEAHLNALNKANIMKKINNPYVEELRGRSMLMFIRAFEK